MSENENKIHIIITGGTIDAHWDGKTDTAINNTESVVPKYLDTMIVYASFMYTTICLKDSRSILRDDVTRILKTIEETPAQKIIVTHGTYTMPDTAKYIEAHLTRKDQVIIFTGSMIPLDGFYPTDAPFNLGYAVAKVDDLAPGIYLAMNGRTFSTSEVAKNLSEGKFYSVFDKEQ